MDAANLRHLRVKGMIDLWLSVCFVVPFHADHVCSPSSRFGSPGRPSQSNGALSIPMMLIQAPGAVLAAYVQVRGSGWVLSGCVGLL